MEKIIAKKEKKMKKVFCWGTFDVIHKGHEKFLKDAKGKGDHLTAIVVPDSAVFENKKKYPINPQNKRAENLMKKFDFVDSVLTPHDFNDTFQYLLRLKPDIFVFGYDQSLKFIEKIMTFLSINGIKTEKYISKEFAGGMHSSDLRKELT